jgi:hypothetical protein
VKLLTDKSEIKSIDSGWLHVWMGDGETRTFNVTGYSTQIDFGAIFSEGNLVSGVSFNQDALALTFNEAPQYGVRFYLVSAENNTP